MNDDADLRRALAKDQFELYFQPKFDLAERRIRAPGHRAPIAAHLPGV